MRAALLFLCLAVSADQRKERPVNKVINLLRDMHKQLQHEQEVDEATFAKMDCWCNTNRKEKNQAVKIADQQVSDLGNAIQEHSAKAAQREVEIKQLGKEIAENSASLGDASAIREKEASEFYQENKELIQAVEMLKNAITVLSKHHSNNAFQQVKSVVRHLMWRHGDKLNGQRKAVENFMQMPVYQSYAPQSSEIFGILGDMKDTMERELGEAKTSEDNAKATFQEFKQAKEEEIAATSASKDTKQSEYSEAAEALARAKEDLSNTRDALAADKEFLSDLNLKCQSTNHEWENRQKTRVDEMAAVTEAIKILSEDDARETFTRSVNTQVPSFLQLGKARDMASSLIAETARRTKSTELLALSVTVKLDAFNKVKKAIDDMVVQLKQEQIDEVKHRDWCNAEFRTNEKSTTQEMREKSDLDTLIGDLTAKIEHLSQEIAEHKNEIGENQVAMKKAGENRDAENKDFQTTVVDQRAAQAVLKKALDRLEVFYKAKQAKKEQDVLTGFAQEPVPGAQGEGPPAGFNKYDKNAGATSVLQMLRNIMEESAGMEKEAIAAENEAQANYDKFLLNANASITALQKQIVSKSEAKASSEEDLSQAELDLATNKSDRQALADYKANLHQSCNFITKNFTIRQQARTEEIEAMQKAKAVLSGADAQ